MPQFGHRLSPARLGPLAAALALLVAASCGEERAPDLEPGPAEAALGKRLFRETRFAQFFAARAGEDMNRLLPEGDPALATVLTPAGPVPGPYRGRSISCAACHLSDELSAGDPRATRAFADFQRRSLVPDRGDGLATTTRNTASLRDSLAIDGAGGGIFLHHDGEHASAEDLVRASFTGRNFGWLPGESALAVAHLANVLRQDLGGDPQAARLAGLPYQVLLAGVAPEIPEQLRLPDSHRIDVTTASDQQLLDAAARLIAAYLGQQRTPRDPPGGQEGSPYDLFLRKNGLPEAPAAGETVEDYGRRLYSLANNLPAPSYVSEADGRFRHLDQPFVFGPDELTGMIKFLGRPGEVPTGPPGLWACSTCHPPPHFSDFRFHNTGVAEAEYDAVHGAGSFAGLAIPGLAQRSAAPEAFLPPSAQRPGSSAVFRAVPDRAHPGRTDLGLWNVMLNPELPLVQPALRAIYCPLVIDAQGNCGDEEMLAATVATFKTRGLRDLGLSGPYFHNGQADTLEQVIEHYISASLAVREERLRNGAMALEWLRLAYVDVGPLAAFLRSLNGRGL